MASAVARAYNGGLAGCGEAFWSWSIFDFLDVQLKPQICRNFWNLKTQKKSDRPFSCYLCKNHEWPWNWGGWSKMIGGGCAPLSPVRPGPIIATAKVLCQLQFWHVKMLHKLFLVYTWDKLFFLFSHIFRSPWQHLTPRSRSEEVQQRLPKRQQLSKCRLNYDKFVQPRTY